MHARVAGRAAAGAVSRERRHSNSINVAIVNEWSTPSAWLLPWLVGFRGLGLGHAVLRFAVPELASGFLRARPQPE